MSFTYEIEDCVCDVCGSNEYDVVWDKNERRDRGVLFGKIILDANNNIIHGRNVMCRKCGLVYVTPRMTRECLKRFYKEEYRNIYNISISNMNYSSERFHAENALMVLRPYIKPFSKVLDVGCSSGQLIELLSTPSCRSMGIEVTGIEASQESASIWVHKGYNIINMPFEDYNTDKRYDIITMLNTLEHVYSPMEFLAKVKGLLNCKGILVGSVPYLLNMSIRRHMDVYLSNAHLYNFTLNSIRNIAKSLGFSLMKVLYIPEEIGDKMYFILQSPRPQKGHLPVVSEPFVPDKNDIIDLLNLLNAAYIVSSCLS